MAKQLSNLTVEGSVTAKGLITSSSLQITGNNSPLSLPSGTAGGQTGQFVASAGTASTPVWRYIATSDFTQSSSPTLGQALVAAPVTGGWSWQSFLPLAGGSLTGALNLSTASAPLQVQNSAGTAGQVLTSAGAGVTPTWTTPAAHTLIASINFNGSAPSFTSIPQTFKKLYAVIIFSNTTGFSGALTYTVNGAGTGFSRFQPGVSTSFTTSAGAAAPLTLPTIPPVPNDSHWVEINNYTQPNSRSIGSGTIYTFGNLIPAVVTSFAFAASTAWGSSVGTAFLYGVN